MLKKMRNVAEHFDDYAMDKGRHTDVRRGGLEVGSFSDKTFNWLNCELDFDVALQAGSRLFEAIKKARSKIVE